MYLIRNIIKHIKRLKEGRPPENAIKADMQRLLNKVNAVGAPHRHGQKIPKVKLDRLVNLHLELEKKYTL